MLENIPFYSINEPYELFYKNEATSYPVGAHTHNAAELYLTMTDLPDVLLNDTISMVPKGSLILIPPFCIHQLYHEKDVIYERYILNIDIHWLENVLCSKQELTECLSYGEHPLILPLDSDQLSFLTHAMTAMLPKLREKSIKNTAEFFYLLSVIDSAVHTARRENPYPATNISKAQKTVNQMITYIQDHLEEKISLADMEAQFYLNRDYLSRLFMKHTHTSIGRYIAIQRIAKAQEYLREGLSVLEVSEKMGFSSYAYFFKVFQKMTGISPSQYRSKLLKNTGDNL